ncbi:MAG: FG-GAP repeat domain-containing protein [Planctomycetota bacterium]|jgi:hypothetical protein
MLRTAPITSRFAPLPVTPAGTASRLQFPFAQHSALLGIFCLLYCSLCGCGNQSGSVSDQDEVNEATSATSLAQPLTDDLAPDHHATRIAGNSLLRPDRILPRFEIVGSESGFDFDRFDDIQGQRRIIETNGGGAGLIDFDRDGWPDVFMTNGCRLPISDDDHSTPSALFRNLSDWRFERVSQDARFRQFGYAYGCAVGDFDADGFDDLYVTTFRANTLWHNNGDGTFSDVTSSTQTDVPYWSSSAAFADINLDGHLDLYVVNYLEESDEQPHLCQNAASPTGYTGCSPAIMNGVADCLLLSDGSGSFIDVSESSGLSDLHGKGLGIVVVDLDGVLGSEIYVANDGQANFLLKPGKRSPADAAATESPSLHRSIAPDELVLRDLAFASATALNEAGFAQASMGIAAGDYDGNGTCDLFMTHFFGDTNTLYANSGDLVFHDASRSSRLGASSREMLGFGTVFFDADSDGWLDLFIANGHVDDRTWMPHPEPYQMPAQLMLNNSDGTFADVSARAGEYFDRRWIGRGVASGDLDRDGRIDLVVSHQLAPSVMLRNVTATSGRLCSLELVGTVSNRNAVGSMVTVLSPQQSAHRYISGGGSFQSASNRAISAYQKNVSELKLTVSWPGGTIQSISVPAQAFTTVIESEGDPL